MPGKMEEESMTGLGMISSAIGCIMGIILIFVGKLILIFGNSTDLFKAAYTLDDTGIFLLGFMLISGGMLSKNTDRFLRLAMIIAGAIVIGLLWGLFFGRTVYY
jgi:uncharacterized membrane protein